MRFEAALVLAEQDAAGWLPTGVVIALAAAIAVVALLGRRRLPAGVGEGAFAAGVSGAVLLVFAVDAVGDLKQAALGHVLTALTVLWYALGRLADRRGTSRRHGLPNAEAGKTLPEAGQAWAFAALVCGLAALVSILIRPPGLALTDWLGVTADCAVLLLLSAVVCVSHTSPWAMYPLAALAVCLLARVIPPDALSPHGGVVGFILNGLALLTLVVVIGSVLRRWGRRRRAWFDDPQRLDDFPFASDALLASLVGLSLVVGLGGLLHRQSALTPTAVLLAALTCLIVGHLRTWLVIGEIGLILAAEGIVTASMAWLHPGWSGALFGLGLAAIYLLWLARFWQQQLNEGVPWTTAGRLIPTARRLSYVASAAAFAAALGGFVLADFQAQSVWLAAVTLLVLLGATGLLVGDGFEHRRPGAAVAACLTVLAAVAPASRLFSAATTSPVAPILLIAAGALLLALRVAAARRRRSTAIYNAYVGGVVPVIVVFALALRGIGVQTAGALFLTAAAVILASKSFRVATPAVEAGPTGSG